jgi:pyruvate/2-oxoacid:ferredoxin oxidoreductase alpha subunit
MAASIGASCAGARAFTATSAQGLALMHEVLHWAAAARLPIVMANINRAMAPGWSIWTEQTDSLAQRDTGWMQYYVENNQEVLDSIIQAFKVAERVFLPAMVVYDAFFISHTSEPVDIPDVEEVDKYLPPFKPGYTLNPKEPHAFGGLTSSEYYYEFRYKMQKAMDKALVVAKEEDNNFKKLFGRGYGIIDEYKTEDADVIMVTSGSIASTTRWVVNKMRKDNKKVGMLKIRLFRPFPYKEVRKALSKCKKVGIIDRNLSLGHSGGFAEEVKSALYNSDIRPPIFGFIIGLGGRDVTTDDIEKMYRYVLENERPKEDIIWRGVKL